MFYALRNEIHLDKLCGMQMAANAWLALQPIRKRKIGNKITKAQYDTEQRFWYTHYKTKHNFIKKKMPQDMKVMCMLILFPFEVKTNVHT